jgi:acetolactate synthase-1/2/3 large subunit
MSIAILPPPTWREAALATVHQPPQAQPAAPQLSVAETLVNALADLGVQHGFGIIGGAAATLCDALSVGPIKFVHCRHETGAAFAATEAHFATGRPTLVVTTTGPGLTNALTGIAAARSDGAKLVVLSASTPAPLRGRWASQETSGYTLPLDGLFTSGPIFHYAVAMEHPAELDEVLLRLASGLSRPGGFVAHVALPTSLQATRVAPPRPPVIFSSPPVCTLQDVEAYARMLSAGPFVIWAGFGARHAAAELRELAERTGARVMLSPRAKGVFPERHPLSLGVTGLGGYGDAEGYMRAVQPEHVLVLGTRLGESTSYWQPTLAPTRSFIHVDIDPLVPGTAYPTVATHAVHADTRAFLAALLRAWPAPSARVDDSHPPPPTSMLRPIAAPVEAPPPPAPRLEGPVRAAALMDAIQRLVVEPGDAVVMTEPGNAFAWGNHHLRFSEPGRYRVSVNFGSMGHFTTGVVGAAIARAGKVVALVGDGSMLMNCEVSTAVQHRAPAVWVVLNDAAYGMVDQGMRALGLRPTDMSIPRVDFVMLARSMGADGARVEREDELDAAIRAAMAAEGPFVVDVNIDPSEPGPWMKRIHALIAQGVRKTAGGA